MKFRNWFWGLFFIVAAIAVILNQLGYFTGVGLFSLVITIFMIPIIIKSCTHLNFSGILFPLAILGIIYAEPLGITALTPWPILLVALLGSIGLSFIFGSFHGHHFCSCDGRAHLEDYEEVIDVQDDSIITHKVSFGASVKYVNSDNFKKANLSCSFGGLKVYFDNAKLSETGAEIYIDNSFGGTELYIPKTWKVLNKVSTSLGAVEEKGKVVEKEGPIVTLKGKVSFGAIEIHYI